MEIKELIDFIFQYGVGFLCIAYFMYFNSTTMKELINNQEKLNVTLTEVSTNLMSINSRLDDIEDKINRKGE